MDKGYLLLMILNDVKRFKAVKNKLRELGYSRFTVIDTYGTTDILDSLEFSNMLSATLSGQSNKKYNKTLFLAIQSEAEVKSVMDSVEAVQSLDYKKPGKGIMFTIPIYTSQGIRIE